MKEPVAPVAELPSPQPASQPSRSRAYSRAHRGAHNAISPAGSNCRRRNEHILRDPAAKAPGAGERKRGRKREEEEEGARAAAARLRFNSSGIPRYICRCFCAYDRHIQSRNCSSLRSLRPHPRILIFPIHGHPRERFFTI